MKTFNSFDRGIAIISIDTEQLWGHFDLLNEAQFRETYPDALAIHDRLLNLLSREGISATWTVVGALTMPGTDGPADSCFSGLPSYWTNAIPAGNEVSRPLWYNRSFVERLISARTPQDVGMHGGVSHLVWGDPRTTEAMAATELSAGMCALRQLGIDPVSFVYPRDLVEHREVLREGGIRCYRGRAPILSERFGYSRVGSVVRAVEEVAKLAPPVVFPEEVLPGLWNIPASMFIYNLSESRSKIVHPKLRVQRTQLGLKAAEKERGIFHLGLHPENLAQSGFAFSVFESMVQQICRFRDQGKIDTMSMADVVNRVAGKKTARTNLGGGRMKGRRYAEFMERRGRTVFYGAGSHWYEVGSGMIMALPYHEVTQPSQEALQELLARTRNVGARYLTTAGNGLAGGLYARRKSAYDESNIHKKARNRLRRAQERCTIREVEQDELRSQGLAINRDTMTRQGRFDSEFGDPQRWNRLVDACYSASGVKVIGAFADGKLIAYVVTLVEDGWLHLLHMFSGTRSLVEHFPNDALAFHLTKMGMELPEVENVSYGVAGLSQSAGLHQFKERYGYEYVPFGNAFVLRPWAHSTLVNPLSEWAMAKARARYPERDLLQRIEAVMVGARQTGCPRSPVSDELAVPLHAVGEEARHG